MKYVIHLDLASFLAQADTTSVGDESLYLQGYTETTIAHGLPASLTSSIVLTYADAGGTVHAARLRLESVSILTDRMAMHQAVRDRTAQARQIVVEALAAVFPDSVRPGLLLVPGLREDLSHYETDHDLWRWEEAQDPLARRLVATSEQQEGVHAHRS